MSGRALVSGVLIDLFDTLVPFPPTFADGDIRGVGAELGVPDVPAFVACWRSREATQSRMTGPIATSIRDVCAAIGHVPADDRLASAMTTRLRLQEELLAHPREDAAHVLKTLRTRGLRVAVLSNCSSDTAEAWARCALSSLVDAAVMSATEGVCKPDPRAYLAGLARLGLAPDECLFVDDNAAYLEPAAELGIRAVQFRAAEAPTREWSGPAIGSLTGLLDLIAVA